MSELLKMCLTLCPFIFLAGFVDSVAGGGGLISLPAYLFVGLPVHVASGTNKFANGIGTAMATARYIKSGKVNFRWALLAAAGALVGSVIGTRVALHLDANVLKIIILCVLPAVAVLVVAKKNFGCEERAARPLSRRAENLLCVVIGLAVGCYDGLIGPGTGTLMMLAFTAVLGIDLLSASGCAKVGNLASNVASVIVWIIGGKVLFAVAIPAAFFSVAGNYLGAHFAIKGGAKRVRWVMLAVLALMFVKIITDLL